MPIPEVPRNSREVEEAYLQGIVMGLLLAERLDLVDVIPEVKATYLLIEAERASWGEPLLSSY